jgi:hypothetical protein
VSFEERKVGLADLYGTTASVNVDLEDLEPGERPVISFRVNVGQCGATGFPTPSAARQLSAALLDAADAVEGAVAE